MKRSVLIPGVSGALAAGVVLGIVTGNPGPYLAGGGLTAGVIALGYWVYTKGTRKP
jgi:hypothetical protein